VLRQRAYLVSAFVLAMLCSGCGRKLPCVTDVNVEIVPVIYQMAILPFDDSEVMEQPIPKTVGMGHYERTPDSGALMRQIASDELSRSADVKVIPFAKVDEALGGKLVTADELVNANGEQPIGIGLRLGADVVVAGRIGLCGEEDAPKSPRSYVVGEIYVFESKSGRLIASLQMSALDYPESCKYVARKMCTKLGLELNKAMQAALERENKLQNQLFQKRHPLPHADRY